MYNSSFIAANDGNISCKVSENVFWVTPTGVSKSFMTEDTLIKMDLDGNVLEGEGAPSSETKMHIRVYKEIPFVNSGWSTYARIGYLSYLICKDLIDKLHIPR